MDKKIRFADVTDKDVDELFFHAAVQTILDVKAVYSEFKKEDLKEAISQSFYSKSVFYGVHLGFIVLFIPSEDKNNLNMFVYGTTQGFSDTKTFEEAIRIITNRLSSSKICSIIYKGNKKSQSCFKKNGFVFHRSVKFGCEQRAFNLFIKEKANG